MLSQEQINAIEPAKRVAMIIFAGLLMGILFFAVITFVVRSGGNEPLFNMDFGIMAIFGVAFAALVLMPSIIVPMIIQKSAAKQVGEEFAGKLDGARAAQKMFGGLQTSMIVGLALLEGAVFFNLIAFLVDGSAFNMITVAVLLACMFVRIPLPVRVDDKIASMLEDAKHQP